MPDTKISALPSPSSVNDSDVTPIVQGGSNFKATRAQFTANCAILASSNVFTVGPQTVQTGLDANKGLILKSNSGTQSGNLLECQTSGGTAQFIIDSNYQIAKIRNVAYTWPSSQGSASTVLTNDGSGNLTWNAAASGAPFADNTTLVKNNADNTKLLIISAASLTTGTTRTITAPDANITLVGNNISNTFSIGPQIVQTGGDTNKGIISRANSGTQSANLLECQTSGSSVIFSISANADLTLTPVVRTTGSPVLVTLTAPAHTTLTASTEASDVKLNLARTVQFSTGAITTQRAVRIQNPTYGFVAASTITTATTLQIDGGPLAGANATITEASALRVLTGADANKGVVTQANSGTQTASLLETQLSTGVDVFSIRISGSNAIPALNSGGIMQFSSTSASTGSPDTALVRSAAQVIGLTNGSTAGATLSSAMLTPTALSANVNNYNPGVARYIRLSTDNTGPETISGLSIGQIDGMELKIINVGSDNIIISHQDTNSTAANRFLCDGGASFTLGANDAVILSYDGITLRWRAF